MRRPMLQEKIRMSLDQAKRPLQHEQDTQQRQEGVASDGMPGKGRLTVRPCAGCCGYYVEPTETSCRNCGLIEPYRERPQARSIANASRRFVILFAVFPLLSLLAGSILFLIG